MKKLFSKSFFLLMISLFADIATVSAATSIGSTDYSSGYGGLSEMTAWVLGLAKGLGLLIYALAAILSLYSATAIYIKINAGEEGFLKSVYILIGSVLFLIFSTMFMPSFFGVEPLHVNGL